MTTAHILQTGFIIAAGVVALVFVVRDIRREWREFFDRMEDE